MRRQIPERTLAFFQGAFYLATGSWPLVHMASFASLIEPRAARWSIEMAGAWLVAIGAMLVIRAVQKRLHHGTAALGLTTASVLMCADVTFVARGELSPRYLGEAALELLLAGGWALLLILDQQRALLECRSTAGQVYRPTVRPVDALRRVAEK
jgi:hypothetical protein